MAQLVQVDENISRAIEAHGLIQVFDLDHLEATVNELMSSTQWIKKCLHAFALKANPALVRHMFEIFGNNERFGMECASMAELKLAMKCGFTKNVTLASTKNHAKLYILDFIKIKI